MLRDVATDRVARRVFVLAVPLIGVGYSLVLPFSFTQRISFANWHYLDLRYVAFSAAFAVGMGWLIAVQVHAVRRIRANVSETAGRTGPLAALAAIVSVLPSLLCCSPILPTLIGLVGLSATARLTTTAHLQHFFAARENLVMGGALAVLVLTGLWSSRKVARANCLGGVCCVPAGPEEGGFSGDRLGPLSPGADADADRSLR
ncbi:hypothetical protein [Conexibacter sp. DBS9H8]|uniref:hypothetical protein n=1 Tax=Conexibacter sp. DBS9H8 TaxID=2937801 RepID=UPI00201035FF|nr:hypothetical protein [Conexibacter sp. DBS9H8]